jgi:hypothetical protein
MKRIRPRRKRGSPLCDQVFRCYSDLEVPLHVKSTEDFLVHIWARNTNTRPWGVEVATPPSHFREPGITGSHDVLVLDVPAMTGMTLGCIGAKAGETIDVQGSRDVVVYLTVVSCKTAKITVTRSG